MTGDASRWNRILKVRAVQRQMAELQLHRCDTELRNLLDLGERIAAIRGAAQPSKGAQNGTMMRSIAELSARLDSAQMALVNPEHNATEARDRQQRSVVAAKQREMAVEKLQTATRLLDAKRASDRQSRTAIFRKTPIFGGMI